MSYEHINARERTCIFYQRQMGHSIRAIARYLGRSHSTISREIKRNIRPHIDSYCDRYAQSCADQRKSIPRHSRRRSDDLLVTYVTEKLQLGWSPEIISNSVKKAFPRQTTKRVHTETIYQWVYNDAMQGGELYRHLVRHHKKRRKQQRYGSLRGHIPNRTDISECPVVVDKLKGSEPFNIYPDDADKGL